MKTKSKINKIANRNKFIITISFLSFVVFITTVVFHISPIKLAEELADFAVHHYFIVGFIALTGALIGLKSYFSNIELIDYLRFEDDKVVLNKKAARRQRLQNFKNDIAFKIFLLKNKISKVEDKKRKRFDSTDVLVEDTEVKKRQQLLNKAMKLGNSFKQNVKLHYKESNINKCVETIVLFVNNEHVTLRGGDILPVKSIYKVEI